MQNSTAIILHSSKVILFLLVTVQTGSFSVSKGDLNEYWTTIKRVWFTFRYTFVML